MSNVKKWIEIFVACAVCMVIGAWLASHKACPRLLKPSEVTSQCYDNDALTGGSFEIHPFRSLPEQGCKQTSDGLYCERMMTIKCEIPEADPRWNDEERRAMIQPDWRKEYDQ